MGNDIHNHPGWGKPTYEVGYGKPPKQHRFKKGQSGNPKGRKKKDTTIRAIMKKIIAETVTAKLPEGEQRMVALEFVLRGVLVRALKGDNRATDKFIDLTLRWCRFLRQGHKVDQPMKGTIHHEDTQTVHCRVQGQGCA